jgi:hypothetical protein
MLEQRELERMARDYLGNAIELTYSGFRPVSACGADHASYHVFFYDLESEAGTYIGSTKAIAIPENGEGPYFLFSEGE